MILTDDVMLINLGRFTVMFLGAILMGLLLRWGRHERRLQYAGIGVGVTLLAAESIIDHFLRLGDPLTWRLPLDLAAFVVLIASLESIHRSKVHNFHFRWYKEHH